MSKKDKPVPRLDLAPKLKRPLSLWNPLDYLRLLYWVFFFPQAVRWYVETFGGEYVIEGERNWQKISEWLRLNAIERQLYLQALVLVVITPVALSWFLEQVGVSINWLGPSLGMVCGVGSVVVSMAFGEVSGIALGVVSDAAFSVMLGALSKLETGADVKLGVVLGVAFGMMVGVTSGVVYDVVFSAMFCLVGAVLGAFYGVLGVGFGVGFGVSFGVAALRYENWFISLLFTRRSPLNNHKALPRVTKLRVPYLSSQLTNWLRQDWEAGIYNINQLLRYTLQFTPVVKAINQVLVEKPPEQIIYRVSQLAENPYDWRLIRFVSISFSEEFKSKVLFFLKTKCQPNENLICPPWKGKIGLLDYENLRVFAFSEQRATQYPPVLIDTDVHAIAAGFWCLRKQMPNTATMAFGKVTHLDYGKEMFNLAYIIAALDFSRQQIANEQWKVETFNFPTTHTTRYLQAIATLEFPPLPTESLLRPTTWEAIKSFQRVIANTITIARSVSRSVRSLAVNRAIGELKNILDNIETIPQAERELIKDIAQTWQKALLELTAEVGQINITEPVRNPYTIGDPVVGKQFAGREDIIRKLQEYWLLTNNPQSIVLFGHRRMGKTSILLNIANLLGSKVKLAYVNLQGVGETSQGLADVLISITDAISITLDVPPPADEDLFNSPYRTFKRYLHQVVTKLDGALIVALDEFEQIEELMSGGYIPKNFMKRLRAMVQMNPKLAFALAGLHTLDEMTQDYFHPFFASIIPIRVGFLTQGATRQILANPGDEDFLLDYQPEALDRIYELTHGQPSLVQRVGFLLVRRYNELTFETGRPQKNIFTIEDVKAVIDNPDFYSHGRYYFTGVWDQAARGAKGQQQILTALAPHKQEGLTLPALSDATGIDTPEMQTALETLERHDVVKRDGDNRWQIAVELLRRWLLLR